MKSYAYLMSTSGPGGYFVEVLESKFHELLREVLGHADVDEGWYLATYRDVHDAVRAGEIKSARDHYIQAGYFENRMPRPVKVDEDWYLREYPDVAEAIRAGAFTSAHQHFEKDGFREGRLPRAGWSLLGSN